MNKGEAFENEALAYLRKNFYEKGIIFDKTKTSDSTKSDIEVIRGGRSLFFIEAKDTKAQAGQFVVFSDEEKKIFKYSDNNKSKINEPADSIIKYMNYNFKRFNRADTAGEEIDMDPTVFANWIIEHYKSYNVKYIITKIKNIIILPIEKLHKYFNITAKYRIKASGSRPPALSNMNSIIQKLNMESIKNCEIKEKRLYVKSSGWWSKQRFVADGKTYYFAPVNNTTDEYEIRCLSDTKNRNVIFSMTAKKEQDPADIVQFKQDLGI